MNFGGATLSNLSMRASPVDSLASQGKAVLLVSSYLPELLGMCDRIAVMRRGRLLPARMASECDATGLLHEALGA